MAGPPSEDGIERLAPARRYPVLYVDDERDNLLVFKAVLGDEFEIRLAQSAAEALELLGRERIAVIVTDQRMPHVSGIELCHRVSESQPWVRRLLLTAYSDHQTAIHAINRGGVHGYLEKPWEPLTLRRALWDQVNRLHLDRMVGELRTALADRDARLQSARIRERMLHDMANATMRLALSARMLRRLVERRGAELPADVRAQLEREAELLDRAADHLSKLQKERAAGEVVGKAETLRLDELLRTVVALSAFPPGDDLRLAVEAPPGLSARGDRVAITRVLANLVSNARHALEERAGGRGEVRIRARAEGERVVLDVVDNGPGIPPALRERIFEESFTTRQDCGGTGLGLATARELARANGGALELAEPQPARGAHFRLVLPAAGAQAVPAAEPWAAAPLQP